MIVASEEWKESRIISQIIKETIATKGAEVEIKINDLQEIYALLANKNIDIFPDVWDNMHDVYTYDSEGFEDICTWYDGAKLGVLAPSYMEPNTLSAFAEDSSLFGNHFYTLVEASAEVSISSKTVLRRIT